ncbi:hypothetical protein SLEP1_g36806 [Rubroshorea leprosula]|uniref:Cupin type-1 domain-containing protein n=1 Tax=Rubroshorea leprosula TaxID=152421 RepID=A0AAV5KT59_9ROSI|nr:hypothetical protein SLEP1_g36806 [Rubroshorea leprosula]
MKSAYLQDFCVAINDTKTGVFVNGKFCKDPKLVVANDFFHSGFDKPRNTCNAVGSAVTQSFVEQLLGLNTLGVSLARIDFAPNGGLNPPHTHPRGRGTETLVVKEGTLFVGFVSSNQDGETPAVAFSGLSSQNPGTITIANSVFGSNPPIDPNVLTKAFMLDKNVVKYLQSHF